MGFEKLQVARAALPGIASHHGIPVANAGWGNVATLHQIFFGNTLLIRDSCCVCIPRNPKLSLYLQVHTPMHSVTSDLDHTLVGLWIYKEKKNCDANEATHLTMYGGKNARFRLDSVSGLYLEMEKTMNARKSGRQQADPIPPITERVTQDGFPFYCDLDFELHCPSLRVEFVDMLMSTICGQLKRFFPAPDDKAFYSIVCSKFREVQQDQGPLKKGHITDQMIMKEPDGIYKLGLHVHWPYLIVNKEQALRIRMSMLSALHLIPVSDWISCLACNDINEKGDLPNWNELFNWDKILDESVYNSGLRLAGCFKSKPCTLCRGQDRCEKEGGCRKQNNKHIIDPVFYDFHSVFDGQDRLSSDHSWYTRVNSSKAVLLRYTTVRSDSQPKDGYFKVYPGCPPLPFGPQKSSSSSTVGGKRKVTSGINTQEVGYAKSMKPIVDGDKIECIRNQLVKHCPKYRSSKIMAKCDDYRIFASLSGDESTWCNNKQDYHGSSHVYMEIFQGNNSSDNDKRKKQKNTMTSGVQMGGFVSVMKCFCPKEDLWPNARGTKMPCCRYRSLAIGVEQEDVDRLFPARGRKGGAKAHARVQNAPR